ncbi:hypothetical protein [Novosphingobium lindaniclasticum]|nr:hypothetical protein [Novosphingobium lindaniclasticum]
MRSVPSLLSMIDEPKAPAPTVLPWDYIRMRREAAGLSIEQAARPYWHRPEHREDVERNFRTLEQPGYRAARNRFGGDKSRSYRVSEAIYRQLCDGPPEQHPRLCLACGWDEWSAQLDIEGFDCTWSDADPQICTLCEQLRRPLFKPRLPKFHPTHTTHGGHQIAA